MKKPVKGLSELPSSWRTRDELISCIISDYNARKLWNELAIAKYSEHPNIEHLWLTTLFYYNSWRLSLFGGIFMTTLYKNWRLKNENNIKVNGKILINMNRILQAPWHLRNSTIVVWNQSTNFELSMFDGDLHQFVEFNLPK